MVKVSRTTEALPEMQESARHVIDRLGLEPLVPEGGYVRQTHLDAAASAIYYLLEAPHFSGLHRLRHLEVWAFHAGSPVSMLLIGESGVVSEPVLGIDLAAGQRPQVVVPAGTWQAAEPTGPWALLSTFVAPPYADDIVDFGRRADFEGRFARHDERIRRLCRF